MKAKQSPHDRLLRLADCRCPVHGTAMTQTGTTVVNGLHAYLAECPRADCGIKGTSFEAHGSLTLLPEFMHLVEPGAAPRIK